jgi:predicted branched-subunit amino acid permease
MGDILPAMVVSALGIAIYGMFIAIVVPPCKNSKPTFLCVLFAIALSCLFKYTPYLNQVKSGFVIIICAVIASLLFAIVAPIKDEPSEKEVQR